MNAIIPNVKPATYHLDRVDWIELNKICADHRRHKDGIMANPTREKSPALPSMAFELAAKIGVGSGQLATMLDASPTTVYNRANNLGVRLGRKAFKFETAHTAEPVATPNLGAVQKALQELENRRAADPRRGLSQDRKRARRNNTQVTTEIERAIRDHIRETGDIPNKTIVGEVAKCSHSVLMRRWPSDDRMAELIDEAHSPVITDIWDRPMTEKQQKNAIAKRDKVRKSNKMVKVKAAIVSMCVVENGQVSFPTVHAVKVKSGFAYETLRKYWPTAEEVLVHPSLNAPAVRQPFEEIEEIQVVETITRKITLSTVVEMTARRMYGETLVAGTYRTAEGKVACDDLQGEGVDARPMVFEWRSHLPEVRPVIAEMFRLAAAGELDLTNLEA